MAEARRLDDALGAAIAAAGRDLAFPPTPTIRGAVESRLQADLAAKRRPPFPRIALWSRRRALAVAAIGILAMLTLAFGARFVLGAAEVRVRPGVTPTGPPLGPGALGEPVPVEEVSAAIPFEVELPLGRAPDEAYIVRTGSGEAALLAWKPDRRYPALPGTPWGLALLEILDDEEVVVKNVDRFDDLREVRVDGNPAFWIDAPHELIIVTADGTETFSVRANVLIWMEDLVTYRMETSLRLRQAIAVAETID